MSDVLTMIEVTTDGLYGWGRGFMKAGQAQAWHDFWDSYDGIFWRVTTESDGSVFLVSVYGGGMIHPMDFTLPVRHAAVRSEVSELNRALAELSKKAGFTYRIYTRRCRVTPGDQVEFKEEKQ